MKQLAGKVFLAAWAVSGIVIVGITMVRHTVAMPGPVDLTLVQHTARTLASPTGVLHIVPTHCSCTDGLLTALHDRKDDTLLLVGPPSPWTRILEEEGFTVHHRGAERLRQDVGLVSGPFLAVLVNGQLAYAGGYFREPAAVDSRHLDVIDRTLAGERVAPLPIFGCPVDEDLRNQLDPLGVLAWLDR